MKGVLAYAGCMPGRRAARLSVKCDPELRPSCVRPIRRSGPWYLLNKRTGQPHPGRLVPDELVTDLLGDSYDLVVASLPGPQP